MALESGTRLGPYETTGAIGAGDADRLARFQREAEAPEALNHPNVAQIYGLHGDGRSAGGGAR